MSDSNSSKQLSKNPDPALLPLEEVAPGENTLMAFYDLEGMGLAIAAQGFTREELVRTVIGQVRDPDPRISQRAILQLRSMMRETLQLNGRIGKAALTKAKNGETQSVTTTGLLRPSPVAGAAPPPATSLAAGRTFINPLPIGASLDSNPEASLAEDPGSVSKRSAVSAEASPARPGHHPAGSLPPAAHPTGQPNRP